MIRIILQGKYDIDSFYYNDTLEIKISNKEETLETELFIQNFMKKN